MSVYESGIFHTWQRTGHLCRFDGDEMILGILNHIDDLQVKFDD